MVFLYSSWRSASPEEKQLLTEQASRPQMGKLQECLGELLNSSHDSGRSTSQLAEIQAPKLSVEELETNKADLYILYFLSLSLSFLWKFLCSCYSCKEINDVFNWYLTTSRPQGWISKHGIVIKQLLGYKLIRWSCEALLISEGVRICVATLQYGVMVPFSQGTHNFLYLRNAVSLLWSLVFVAADGIFVL